MSEQFLRDLKRLVAIRSVRGEAEDGAPYGRGPKKALEVAEEIIKEHGFTPRMVADAAVDFDYNDGETALAILAHLDVVPEGDGWETDPYQVAEKDGRYYGRGVSDDKGPALCALYALSELKKEGVRLKNNVRVIFGSDEECGSDDLKRYFAENKPPKYLFSPDAEYPVVNTEKGRIRLKISTEKDPSVVEISGGRATNIVPNTAYAVIRGLKIKDVKCRENVLYEETKDGIKITVHGKSAHASTPKEGDNAITGLLSVLSEMGILKELAEIFPHGRHDGEALGIKCSDEVSGELTIVPSVIYCDEKINVECDVRVPVSRDGLYREIKNRKNLEIEVVSHTDGHHVPADSELVKALNEAFEKATGRTGGTVSTGGGTYVHNMEKYGCEGVAFGACMPETDTRMHGANEFAVKDELAASIEIFKEAIKNICGVV